VAQWSLHQLPSCCGAAIMTGCGQLADPKMAMASAAQDAG